MFLELAELLDCPVCADGFGLVAFVVESESRRVVSGSLGCPICEVEFSIEGGAIHLVRGGEPGDEAHAAPSGDENPQLALRIAALLGAAERDGSAVLLGPGLGEVAPRLTALPVRMEVLAVVDEGARLGVSELAAGVNPLVGLTTPWPIRDRALHGVALRGRTGATEARRCLRPDGRLVVIGSVDGGAEALEERGFSTLAVDGDTWVGTPS